MKHDATGLVHLVRVPFLREIRHPGRHRYERAEQASQDIDPLVAVGLVVADVENRGERAGGHEQHGDERSCQEHLVDFLRFAQRANTERLGRVVREGPLYLKRQRILRCGGNALL